MKISQNGLKLIEEFEGCRLVAYQDSVGVWTIGYGHTKGVKKGQAITKEQAEHYLQSDVGNAEKVVNKYYDRYKWNQNQFDALVSFAFNIGSIDQLTAKGTRSIAEISNKILAYNKAGGKALAGLTRRRKAEKLLFDKKAVNSTPKEEKAENGAKTEACDMATLRRGSTGTAVKVWQIVLGFEKGQIDGVFGAYTEQRTIEYQAQHNLKKDGVVGSKTWEAGVETLWGTA